MKVVMILPSLSTVLFSNSKTLLRRFSKASALTLLALSLSGCFSLFSSSDDAANNQAERSEEEQEHSSTLVRGKSSRASLKSLDLQPVRGKDIAIPKLTLAQKRDQYAALIKLVKDPKQKQQIAFRLADIKMMLAEQNVEQGSMQAAELEYADAIADYRKVLEENIIVAPTLSNPLSEEQVALNNKQMEAMYQLTRALDLAAQSEQSMLTAKKFLETFNIEAFGLSPYHLELFFRIGEFYFNRQQYPQAVTYYARVLQHSDTANTPNSFYTISAYMLGWSHFKLDQYNDSMQGFATMLDASLLKNEDVDNQQVAGLALDNITLPKGELRLVKDALRMMALTFSYQGNATAIAEFFDDFGAREYEHLIYDELAQQHLDDDRYQDSASVLLSFAERYPTHTRAVEYFIRHIDAYVLGEFPSRVLTGKQAFVEAYSLGFGIVDSLESGLGQQAAPYLREYIRQLAQTEHSIAQNINKVLLARENASQNQQGDGVAAGFSAQNISEAQGRSWQKASKRELQALSQQAFNKAKEYYQNFIRSFAPDSEVALMRYYLAEALLALGENEQAIAAFEAYAYLDAISATAESSAKYQVELPPFAEGAYAALVIYQQWADAQVNNALLNVSSKNTREHNTPLSAWQQSQANFAMNFAADARSANVVRRLMQDLFEQQNYQPAQSWASWLLARAGDMPNGGGVNADMQQSANLVMAHSYFAMQMYAQAEQEYRALMRKTATNDPLRSELSDRLAASLYKQAEYILTSNRLDTASLQANAVKTKAQLTPEQLAQLNTGLNLLQKVLVEVPNSQFRLAAQYDSAVYYMLLEQWTKAIATFTDFKTRYPEHELSKGIPQQLLYAYQQSEQWPKAANILLALHNKDPKSEDGRLALFQAAEYFEKAGDRSKSLDTFRRYAHQYPNPLAQANEARYQLSEFYLASGEDSKRRFWLKKIINAQNKLIASKTEQVTPRSAYLASFSAMVFARDADTAYTRIKLGQPLNKSLANKQRALKHAIAQYEQVIGFGSADYVTQASFHLANLYTTLAGDLMQSARPEGLSQLELSQYEILLEEQAYPFEETAISMHEKNIARVQSGLFDDWIKASFEALKTSMPGRYNKPEIIAELRADDF